MVSQSFEERLSGAQAPAVRPLGADRVPRPGALYSWSIPLAVILVVPLGVLGALLGVSLRGLPNDIYFKVGLITIIGLSAKNAILIIGWPGPLPEGMSLLRRPWRPRACARPIVMTSLAFGFGVVPLALSSGAGSGAQVAIGTGVLGGSSPPRYSRCSWYRCSSWWSGACSGCARRRAPATRPRSPTEQA